VSHSENSAAGGSTHGKKPAGVVTLQEALRADSPAEQREKPPFEESQASDRSLPDPIDEPAVPPPAVVPVPVNELPKGFSPWWQKHIQTPQSEARNPIPVTVESLIQNALYHSPFIRIAQQEPVIRRTIIRDEVAQFDWKSFVESRYNDFSDPVGNTLTTGGSPRFRDNHWTGAAGVKQRNDIGGEFRAGQQFGFQDTNSNYFSPTQQGTARLELSYTQPLLNHKGRAYNRSNIMLAQFDAVLADDDSRTQIQNQLLKITECYWQLYRARAVLLQKTRLLNAGERILDTLEARREVDAVERQVLRARSAVATRRTLMTRSSTDIRNAESQLRLLVKDPGFVQEQGVELIPQEIPLPELIYLSPDVLRHEALQNRPDLAAAIQKVKMAGVRLDVSKNELLPKLDLLLMTYAAGLQGQTNMPGAWGDQFTQGEPGYSVGLNFEVPLGNRSAKARRDRRQLELTKLMTEFEATTDAGLTEVEIAHREMETAFSEMISEASAVQAAVAEERYLFDRWKVMPGDDRTTTLLLEDLLGAQDRRAISEERFVTSQVRYVLNIAYVKKATGTLFRVTWVKPGKEAELTEGTLSTTPKPQPKGLQPASATSDRPSR
jgi:outer membrane protein TolC